MGGLQKSCYPLSLLLCLGILCGRAAPRIFVADFWAEDGDVYISDSLLYSWPSLILPYAGSFHVGQRLVSLILVKAFPPALWPSAIVVFCVLVTAFVFAQISRSEYRWLISSDRIRLWVSALFCLSPGLNEMLGNLANLNWILTSWMALLSLRDKGSSLRNVELLGISVVISSVGTSLLLLPLFVLRGMRGSEKVWRRIFPAASIIAVNALHILLVVSPGLLPDSFWMTEGRVISDWKTVLLVWPVSFHNGAVASFLFRPWVGAGLAGHLIQMKPHALLTIGLEVIVFLWLGVVFKNTIRKEKSQFLYLFLLCFLLWPVLAMLARPWAEGTFRDPCCTFWGSRYAYPLGWAAILFWASILLPEFGGGIKRKGWSYLFLGLSGLHGLDRFPIRSYRDLEPKDSVERHWEFSYQTFESLLKEKGKREFRIPIYPGFRALKSVSLPTDSQDAVD